jgi:hypothetical protein
VPCKKLEPSVRLTYPRNMVKNLEWFKDSQNNIKIHCFTLI